MGIGSIASNSKYWGPLWKGVKNFVHDYSHFVVGVEQSEKFSEVLTKSVRGEKVLNPKTNKYIYEGGKGFTDFKGSLKDAWNKSKEALFEDGKQKSFWNVIKDSFAKIPEEFKAIPKEAKWFAKEGKLMKGLGVLGKRMPLIGNVLMIAFELPNIVSAFTDKEHGGGIGTGLMETGKAALKLGAFAVGAAIGAVIPPPFIGSMIGGFAASWVADKLLGKSFTDKVEENKNSLKKGVDADPRKLGDASAIAQTQPQVQSQMQQSGYQPAQLQNGYIPLGNLTASAQTGFDPNADFMSQVYSQNMNTVPAPGFVNLPINQQPIQTDPNAAFIGKKYSAFA